MKRFQIILVAVVLDRIECSVLAVKPDGFVSPVSLPDT